MLCNITEQTWILHRTHGMFVVAGRVLDSQSQSTDIENSASEELSTLAGDAPYALTRISARTGAIDLGDKRTLEFPISARDIAEDLAREINADGGEASYFGSVYCVRWKVNVSEDELAEARASCLELFYASLSGSLPINSGSARIVIVALHQRFGTVQRGANCGLGKIGRTSRRCATNVPRAAND